MSPPNLKQLQSWLKWVFTEARGIETALERPQNEPQPRCLDLVLDQPPIKKKERMDIYAQAYFLRILDCLEANFPATKEVLEREIDPVCFKYVVVEYLRQYPSRSPIIEEVGKSLPFFLGAHVFGQRIPYLYELSLLEWELVSLFFANRNVRYRVWTFRWAVIGIWRDKLRPNKEQSECVLLVRDEQGDTTAESISALEGEILTGFSEGKNLEQVCIALEAKNLPELPPLSDWFQKWTSRGLLDLSNDPSITSL